MKYAIMPPPAANLVGQPIPFGQLFLRRNAERGVVAYLGR
jgi:hypothetical protein